ncbi:MAG: hypothetical protein IPH52_07400 [Leptospiraceae bacterium]|nr:hypothetical protein [Leptospiraceae bacterium]
MNFYNNTFVLWQTSIMQLEETNANLVKENTSLTQDKTIINKKRMRLSKIRFLKLELQIFNFGEKSWKKFREN